MAWYKGNKALESGENISIEVLPKISELTVKNATKQDEGVYRILVHNELGQDVTEVKVKVKGQLTHFLSFLYRCLCFADCEKFPNFRTLRGSQWPLVILKRKIGETYGIEVACSVNFFSLILFTFGDCPTASTIALFAL